MEIYVMKKKFVLVLALVSLVAMSAFAADKTPVTVSGKARVGYKFTFQQDTATKIAAAKSPSVYLNNLSVSGDVFKIGFSDLFASTSDDDWSTDGYAEIYLDKIAKAAGSDWGKFTLTIGGGSSKANMNGPIVYSDPNSSAGDNSYAKVRMAGKDSAYMTIGYDKYVSIYLAGSPTNWVGDAKKKSFLINAVVTPVDGLKVAAGYTGVALRTARKEADKAVEYGKGAFGGSVLVDVKTLAKLDFDLKVSAIDAYYFAGDDAHQNVNDLMAAVSGGMDSWAAYVEYQMFGKGLKTNQNAQQSIIGKFTYKGIKNTSLYAKYTLTIEDSNTNKIGFGGSYAMAPVSFAVDANMTFAKDKNMVFDITPYFTVVF
jgi:hypothetical protein